MLDVYLKKMNYSLIFLPCFIKRIIHQTKHTETSLKIQWLIKGFLHFLGASGPSYAMLSAHLANIILHHTSMSRPFLRLIGLLCIASLEVGWGIYRRYAPPEPEKPQISFAAHLAGVLAGLTFGLVILRNYEQKLSERKAWWLTMCLLLGLSFTAFLYQRLRNNPAFTLLCTDHPCPS